MNYVAKYIVVDEPSKDGDMCQYPPNPDYGIYKPYIEVADETDEINDLISKRQKVKLFLCSYDVKIGDDIYDKVGRLWKNCEKCWYDAMKSGDQGYKVIAEISAGAKWLKNDQEIDKKTVNFLLPHRSFPDQDVRFPDEENMNRFFINNPDFKEKYPRVIGKIRCPMCETYH